MTPPEPIIVGGRIQCPIVDVARLEQMSDDEAAGITAYDLPLCEWNRRMAFWALWTYKRHFRKIHLEPFAPGTRYLMEAILKQKP